MLERNVFSVYYIVVIGQSQGGEVEDEYHFLLDC